MMRWLLLAAALAGCSAVADVGDFPRVDRPVARIVSDSWSDEAAREADGEVAAVLDFAGVAAGDHVADIGAGSGFYVQPLAERVGPQGRVYAEDIIAETLDRLRVLVRRKRLGNVQVVAGTADDPGLPSASLDHALLIHMYHEVENPYALLWHLRGSLKPDGRITVVDTRRETYNHGTPPALLDCELAALGLVLERQTALKDGVSYARVYRASAPRPAPAAIRPCAMSATG